MARDFFNERRKATQTVPGYQQVAERPAKPESAPVIAREPAGKRAKQATGGVDTLRIAPTGGRGVSWIPLALVVVLIAAAAFVFLVVWPSQSDQESRQVTSAEQRVDTRPSAPEERVLVPPTVPRPVQVPPGVEAHENFPSAQQPPQALSDEKWEQVLARGEGRAVARQWPQAAADFGVVLRLHPEDHWHWFRQAALLAWTQDKAAYRRLCADMLQRFSEPTDADAAQRSNIVERTAKACLLLPDAADVKATVRLADQAAAATDNPSHPYFLMASGLAHYRAGEFEKALEQARKAISGNPMIIGLDTPAHLIVAMSHHRLGQAADARKALDQARDIMAQDWFPKLESGELGAAWWHDWLICQILRREAEVLIEGKKTQ